MLEGVISGFGEVLSPVNLAFITLGVGLGYLVGVLPGLNRPTAIAVLLPLTFYLQPVTAICFLIGVAKGSATGGAATAVLLNAPGESSSAATCLDGYPLTRRGLAEKALKVAVVGSVFGDLAGTIVLIAIAQPLARLALLIGPFELAAILVFSLSFIAALSGGSALKGVIAAALGVLCATPGLDPETGMPRLTFGAIELSDGLPLVPVTVGLLALSEMIQQMCAAGTKVQSAARGSVDKAANRLLWSDLHFLAPTFFRSSFVGIVVGMLPGLGASVGSFMSYATAQRFSRAPEGFGKGALEGVAAAETADNAVVPASLVPLFALGIPGSVAAALLAGAFMIHGVVPGPTMFSQHPELIGGIYAGMIVAAIIMLIMGWAFLKVFARVASLPQSLIIPNVLALCIVGAYLENGSIFGVYVMLAFGALGVLMRVFGFPLVTFLVGFIVGPLLEHSLRQALILANGSWTVPFTKPLALAFLVLAMLNLALSGRMGSAYPQRRTEEP